MLRNFRYKYLHYAGGYDPELYDLEADPEELRNVAADPTYAHILGNLREQLLAMIDPEEVNDRAIADQRKLIDQLEGGGGHCPRAKIAPVPGEEPEIVR